MFGKEFKCPKCGSDKRVKSGFNNKKQRYCEKWWMTIHGRAARLFITYRATSKIVVSVGVATIT